MKFGRLDLLTADAVVRTVSGDREATGFSIAINDTYCSGGEEKKVTTSIDCSYWLNTGIAEYLKKGGWGQLHGRIGVSAYLNNSGSAKASYFPHRRDQTFGQPQKTSTILLLKIKSLMCQR